MFNAPADVEINKLEMGGPKVYHIPAWDELSDPKRLEVIGGLIEQFGRDPRIATAAVDILKRSGVSPRDYQNQAAALLRSVQNDIYYVNEPGERLQDPIYTLKIGYGDCDDLVILLCSFFESIALPWRLVISGVKKNGDKVRYIQGDKNIATADWTHIYCMVGNQPFHPKEWFFCEPTIKGVPLGWDVIEADDDTLPELLGPASYSGLPIGNPGRGMATGIGIGVGAEVARGTEEGEHHLIRPNLIKEILIGVAIAVGSSVLTELVLDRIQGKK